MTCSAIMRVLPISSPKSMGRESINGKSKDVVTAATPGRASALLVSMERMRAWA